MSHEVAGITFKPNEISKVLPPEKTGDKESITGEENNVQIIAVALDPRVLTMFQKVKAKGIYEIDRTAGRDEGR